MATLRKRNGKWQVQVRRTGHKPRAKSFHDKADAQRWARQIENEMDRGVLVHDPRLLEATPVADLLRRYLATESRKKRGHGPEAKRIEAFLREDWATLPVVKATAQVFGRYRDERLKVVQPGTVLRDLGLLRSIFEVARKEWDVPLEQNPIAQLKKPKASVGRTRRLNAGELDCLISSCDAGRTAWLRPAILLAIETGLRRGELLNIRWQDYDAETRTLNIPHTKNGYSRRIPLTEQAEEILRERDRTNDRPTDLAFPVSGNALRLAWERCRVRARKQRPDIADLRFHDLRHEAVSRFFELGLSVPEVALISGHRDPRMLFRYTHLRAEDIVRRLRSNMPSETAR